MILSIVVQAALLSASPLPASQAIPNDTPVHLGISLRFTHADELAALRLAQQNPVSKDYRRWLTPREFGERFGQPAETYARVAAWLEAGGLSVTLHPNRLFLEALGKAAQVERLLGAPLAPVEGQPPSVHTLGARVRLPPDFAPLVLNISGLDTRVRYQRRIAMGGNSSPALGPQDLRRFYGLQPLLDQGYVGQGQKLVVLSTATPPGNGADPVVINYFLRNISNVQTPFVVRNLPNPQNDFDPQSGAGLEFDLDVEMQSVGVPDADSITLLVAPASEVFTTGANDIANNLPDTTSVSISLGLCEKGAKSNDQITGLDEIGALRQAVIQGVTEGQTWSAASGDTGADDCRDKSGPAVDFPSSIPEMVAAGGSMISAPAWNSSSALTAYQQEVTWNGAQGGAGGGGISILFPVPAYQAGLTLGGQGRSVPDLALISGPPAVAVDDQVSGQLDPVQGTSVASPLSAGFFALIASRVGCRLGDVHATLYALGLAQQDGGAQVFHDITSGNLTLNGITGPSAGPGYDSATGWGSVDVAALAAAWPPCPGAVDGGSADSGSADPDGGESDGGAADASVEDGGAADAGLVPYVPCSYLACDGGTTCTTIPLGPSTCLVACDPADAGSCPSGSVCSGDTIFSTASAGECIPGCLQESDCAGTPGTVCSTCIQTCLPAGAVVAHIGDACSSDAQCPSGAYCSVQRTLAGGYCTQACIAGSASGSACGCPPGTTCGAIGRMFQTHLCLANCGAVGEGCGRTGYLCQPQAVGSPACLPKCTVTTRNGQAFDSCQSLGAGAACEVDSGLCGGSTGATDGGTAPDAGASDGGDPADSGVEYTVKAAPTELGAPPGCGCGAAGMSPFALAFGLWLARRRRAGL